MSTKCHIFSTWYCVFMLYAIMTSVMVPFQKHLEGPLTILYNGIFATWHGTIMHRFRDDYICFHVSKTTTATANPIDSYCTLAWVLKLWSHLRYTSTLATFIIAILTLSPWAMQQLKETIQSVVTMPKETKNVQPLHKYLSFMANLTM